MSKYLQKQDFPNQNFTQKRACYALTKNWTKKRKSCNKALKINTHDILHVCNTVHFSTVQYKGPAIKKLMPLVVIIEAHDAVRNFWIW